MTKPSAVDLFANFAHLGSAGDGVAIEVTPQFWQQLISGEFTDEGPRRAASPGWLLTTYHKYPLVVGRGRHRA